MSEYALTLALVYVAGYAVAWLQLGLWRLLTVDSGQWTVDSERPAVSSHRPLTTNHRPLRD